MVRKEGSVNGGELIKERGGDKMINIEVSVENYNALVERQGFYNVPTLNDVITILLQETDIKVTTETMAETFKVEKKQAIKKSTDVKAGYLWQTFAKRLPDFPYDFRELFDIHGAFPSPIDAIAFPGLSDDNIIGVHLIDYQLGQYLNGKHKRQVKKCIDGGNMKFRLIRPQDVGIVIPQLPSTKIFDSK